MHVSSYFLQERLAPELPALFERVRANGATTSVDPNWDPAERWDGGLLDLLGHIDVLLPNATEATRIAGRARARRRGPRARRARRHRRGEGGRRGRRARPTANGLVHAGAPTVDALDTTGAGDAFDAGYLASMLAGNPVERSLAIANACGALSTRAGRRRG